MAAARLRFLASRIRSSTMVAKRWISLHKSKSGLWVPEGYEKTTAYDGMREFIKENWYKMDESAWAVIIQTVTKYALVTASGGGGFILLNMGHGRLNKLEYAMAAVKKEQEAMKSMRAESEKTEETFRKIQKENDRKFQKLAADAYQLKIMSELGVFGLIGKNFDPKVLAQIQPEYFYDPVKILKNKYNRQEAYPTLEQSIKLKVAFAVNNKNGNGLISNEELGAIMKALGINCTQSELHERIKKVDTDGDGAIGYREFLSLMEQKKKDTDLEEDIRISFALIDKDDDGYISTAELRHVISNFGEKPADQDVEKMIREVDPDGDNRVTFADFKRLMLSK